MTTAPTHIDTSALDIIEVPDVIDGPPVARRRWLAYTLFGLLLVALMPFLVLCLVFCLKLFLAAVIITVVALLLIAGACMLYSLAWLISRMADRRQQTKAERSI